MVSKTTTMMVMITLVLALVVQLASLSAHAQVAMPQQPYHTAPIYAWTFDTDPTAQPKYAGSSYTYLGSFDGRQGVISLTGTSNLVNLATHTDDLDRKFTDAPIGGSLTFEAWVNTPFSAVNVQHIVNFGTPSSDSFSIGIAQSSLFVVAVVNNLAYYYSSPWDSLPLSQWVHVACTIRGFNSTTGVYTLFINGTAVTTGVGELPLAVPRANVYLGQGEGSSPRYIDSVLIYDYALDAEAIAAHAVMSRVPVYELTFGVDPRIALGLANSSTAAYNWSAGVVPHVGMLVPWSPSTNFTVNLIATNGTTSVGTTAPAVIGGAGWPIATGQRVGWSFEITFLRTQGSNQFYFHNAADYYSLVQMVFGSAITLSSGFQTITLPMSQPLQTNVWYTLVVVMRPSGVTAYVNGVNATASTSIFANFAFSNTQALLTMNGNVDSFRVYDYALFPGEVAALYQVVSGGGGADIPPQAQLSSSAVPLPSSTTPLPSSTASSANPLPSSSAPLRASSAPLPSSASPLLASSAPMPSSAPLPSSASPLLSSASPLPSSSPPLRASSAPLSSSANPLPSSSAPLRASSSPLQSSASPLLQSSAIAPSSSIPFSLSSAAPTSPNPQQLYNTAPIFAWTFDSDATTQPKYAGSSYTYVNSSNGRQGVVSLNGITNFVNLATHTDDLGRNLSYSSIGGPLSFETWVFVPSLMYADQSIFDFGGATDNSFVLGKWMSYVFFQSRIDGNAYSVFYSDTSIIPTSQWVHLATTTRKLNATTAEHVVYVNATRIGSVYGPVPAAIPRTSSFIGRSNTPWFQSFDGLVDSLLVYDYALDAEAVAAHVVVPRVPVYELTFGVDPRIALGLVDSSSAAYGWSVGEAPHIGVLTPSSSGATSVDLLAPSGTFSVGTTAPAVIGGAGWPSATGQRIGWTLEVTFLFAQSYAYSYFYFYQPSIGKYVEVSMDTQYVQVSSNEQYIYFTPQTLRANVWNTLVVVMRPSGLIVYLNGANVGSSNAAFAVSPIVVTQAQLSMSGPVDSFRVYDYALEASEVAALYQVVSLGAAPNVPSSSGVPFVLASSGVPRASSSAPAPLPSSSAAPRPSSSAPVALLPSSSAAPRPSSSAPVTLLPSSSATPRASSSAPATPIFSSSSAPVPPTPVIDAQRALSPRHGTASSYDAVHVRTVSRELLDRQLTLSQLSGAAADDALFSWSLPFSFRVGTVITSNVTVSTNGNLQFGGGGRTSYRFVPEPLPKGDGELLPLLSFLFTDLNLTSPSQLQVGTLGTAPERVALLRVTAAGTTSNRSASSSIDVLLFEGVNRMEVRYYSVGVFAERTLIALQNANVNDFAVFWNAEALSSDARALLDGSTIVFQPRAAFVEGGAGIGARRLRRRLLFSME